jgi:hypothetical protein
MATRHRFGGDIAAWTMGVGSGSAVTLTSAATVTFWSAQTGGTQYTNLASDAAGSTTFTSVTSSNGADGYSVGSIEPFYGPPDVAMMWASANSGPRMMMIANDVGLDAFGTNLNIPRFASAAARDSAIPAPGDGQHAFRTDLHAPQYYHGGLTSFVSPGLNLLSRQTLAVDTASVSLTSIPQDFGNLQVRMKVRTTATANTAIRMTFNSDGSNAYEYVVLVYNSNTTPGTAHTGSNGLTSSFQLSPVIMDSSLAGGQFSNHIVDILDYSDTGSNGAAKTVYASNSRFNFPICHMGGNYYPAGIFGISTITFTLGTGSFKTGSVFNLYGLS